MKRTNQRNGHVGGVSKSVRKACVGFMATLMALSMLFTVPAFAVDASVVPPEKSNLYIHKTTLSDSSYVGEAGTGELVTLPSGMRPVNGVQYDLYLIDTTGPNGTPPSGPGHIYTFDDTGAPTMTAQANGESPTTYPLSASVSATTANDGTVLFGNLPQGLYLVVEDLDASSPTYTDGSEAFIYLTTPPFIVSVPMSNAAGDAWLTDIHVYPKNEALSIAKTMSLASGSAVGVGEEVTYTITTPVPVNIATSTKYDVVDTIDTSLRPIGANIPVPAVSADGIPMTVDQDYTVAYDNGSGMFRVAFTSAGRTALVDKHEVTVTLPLLVNQGILSAGQYSVANNASLEYTNADGVLFTADTGNVGPVIHTAAIAIKKVDENGNPLAGAEFRLASSRANAEAGNFLRQNATTLELLDVGDTGYDTAVAFAITSDASGTTTEIFEGLRDVVDVDGNGTIDQDEYQTYWIVETIAPQDYNRLTAPVSVQFDGNEAGYTLVRTVENNKGFMLPITGGMGAILLTVGGVVLIGLAVILLISRKKKNAQESTCEQGNK